MIDSIDIREACWSRGDTLCVKLASHNGVRTVNRYKRNLNQDFNCDDFIPRATRMYSSNMGIRSVLGDSLASLQFALVRCGKVGSGFYRLNMAPTSPTGLSLVGGILETMSQVQK